MTSTLRIPEDQTVLWGKLKPGVEQLRAVELAAQHRVMILTGGPGVGKSASTAAILALFEYNNLTYTCMAPTGKAASRMAELTGRPAATIHRSIIPVYGLAQKALTSNAVIVDEMSMVDALLFSSVCAAIPDDTRLVLVGDCDQLPSIRAGRVFGDMIFSGKIPVARLTQIYRQASESRIPYVARDINEGRFPDLSLKGTDVSHIEVAEDMSITDENERRDTQLSQMQQILVHAVTNIIPTQKGIPVSAIQVLCAQKNRAIGVEEMNRVLQEAINPQNGRNQIWIGAGYNARAGDKVMQKRNNYDFGPGVGEGVFNGEIGIVEQVAADAAGFVPDEGVLTSYRNPNSKKARKEKNVIAVVSFDDGTVNAKRVGYTKDEARDLHLAYASTIHSYQGSQARAVVMPVHSTHNWMLTRKLVYTGITRAERFMLFVGVAQCINKAARTTRGDERRTSLYERLRGDSMRVAAQTATSNEGGAKALTGSAPTALASSTPATSSLDMGAFWAAQAEGSLESISEAVEAPADPPSPPCPPSTTSTKPSRILPGHYVVNDSVYRVVEKKRGGMAGKTLVEKFDPKMDAYLGVAFVNENTGALAVWKKQRDDLTMVNELKALEADPRIAGEAYARKTGRCVVCARRLTDEASVARSVGPDCAARWF